jgi:RHS repeat-associated protein
MWSNLGYDGQNQYLYDGEGRNSTPRTKTRPRGPRFCAVASSPIPGMTAMTGCLCNADRTPSRRPLAPPQVADGTRVAKGSISAWSCDPGVNGFQTTSDYILGPPYENCREQSVEMGVDANNSMAWQHTNVWAAGKLLATYDNDGLHFYLNDPLPGSPAIGLRRWGGLGTRRAQTDYAGVLEQTCSSLPFGDGLSCSGGNLQSPTEHHFTGKERDTESGNDYFGARYYASSMGRFMSPDWSAKVMPVPYASLGNPQSLNLYAYVGNNPLIHIDPDGHWDISLQLNVTKDINTGKVESTKWEFSASASKEGDNGASLASQLGLKGKDAAKFAQSVGSSTTVNPSQIKSPVQSAFQRMEGIMNAPPNGRPFNCSATAAYVGYGTTAGLRTDVFALDKMLSQSYSESPSKARSGDILRYADHGTPEHFTSYIYTNDFGDDIVFSRSGINGPTSYGTAGSYEGLVAPNVNYGTISGYYRP